MLELKFKNNFYSSESYVRRTYYVCSTYVAQAQYNCVTKEILTYYKTLKISISL